MYPGFYGHVISLTHLGGLLGSFLKMEGLSKFLALETDNPNHFRKGETKRHCK